MDGGDADRRASLYVAAKPSMYVGRRVDQRGRPGLQASISGQDASSWVVEAAQTPGNEGSNPLPAPREQNRE